MRLRPLGPEPAEGEVENSVKLDKVNGDVSVVGKESVTIGSGDEPLILGDSMSDLWDDFVTEVSNILTTTAIGTQPILNKALILKYRGKLKDVLSKYSKTQ